MANVTSKYDDHLAYVQANLVELGNAGCAAQLGITLKAFKTQLTKWRNEGHDVPYLRKAEVGDVRYRMDRGVLREYVKTATGWKLAEPKARGGARPMRRKAAKKVVQSTRCMRREPKPAVERFANRVIDMSEHRWCKVDNKKWVLKKIA